MPRDANLPQIDPQDKHVFQIAELLERAVDARVGPDATFEERQRVRVAVMADAMWLAEDGELQRLRTDVERVEVDGKIYRRLSQPSSATYHGLWGTHVVAEPLYRDVAIHGGPTIKPIELRVGVVRHMLPDFARVVGRYLAFMTSRQVEAALREMGLRPPGRAFIEKRAGEMACDLNDTIEEIEAAAPPALPDAAVVAAVSCGLDRMAVRMHEPIEGEAPKDRPQRKTPYERTQPPPAELNWRMAFVGTVTIYDDKGGALQTLRYAANADADRDAFAERVVADVSRLVERFPGISVGCIQDGAKDIAVLPETLGKRLPANTPRYTSVDLLHLLGYLHRVVETCEPAGDPRNMKRWYHDELLRDDEAIDRIFVNLRRQAEKVPRSNPEGRSALAKALRYIKNRRNEMRYARLRAANLPVGSGATESTCKLMQLRLKHPGMSWETDGLRGISTLRTLVLSERWPSAWEVFAGRHRREVLAA